MKKFFLLFTFHFLLFTFSKAQDLSSMFTDEKPKPDFTIATFKSTRVVNFHTIETNGKRTLDFRISHRFGNLSSGAGNFWGLDGPADIRLALEYSLSNRLQLGIGRTSSHKVVDGFTKFRLVRQTTNNKIPVSITLLAATDLITENDPNANVAGGFDRYQFFTDRFCYVFQFMLARKISDKLSLQVSPTIVHLNIVDKLADKNDIYGLVVLGRYKLTKRFAITSEYCFRLNQYSTEQSTYNSSFSIGFDLETGGHVFQIHLTNSLGIDEPHSIPFTIGNPLHGDMKIGFNISRAFWL